MPLTVPPILWLGISLFAPAFALGQVTNRVQGRIQDSELFLLNGNVPRAITEARDAGPVAPSQAMPRMSIHFTRTAAQQQDLEELLRQQQTRGGALYHHWLSPQQYADRFSVSRHDAESVAAWLQAAGFHNVEIPPSRTSVSFSGTAGQAQQHSTSPSTPIS